MAHLVESMAYSGETPWHGLGVRVNDDLTPEEMLIESGCNWQVEKRKIQVVKGKVIPGRFALVRETDGAFMGICADKFKVLQNDTCAQFFTDFVKAGNMKMHTMGSLDDGKRFWALAEMQDGFSLANRDRIDSYLLLCNSHKPGQSLSIAYTPTRVVCNNTLQIALSNMRQQGVFKMRHSSDFNKDMQEQATNVLNLSKEAMKDFKECAEFLTSKKVTDNMLNQYFVDLFQPNLNDAANLADHNRAVNNLKNAYEVQPGVKMSAGTWWTAFNAVTYYVDHHAGLRTQNNRVSSAMFGQNAVKKRKALELAITYANAA